MKEKLSLTNLSPHQREVFACVLRFAAEQVDNLAKTYVGNTKADGTRDYAVYEQGIGCEQAAKMLIEMAAIVESNT